MTISNHAFLVSKYASLSSFDKNQLLSSQIYVKERKNKSSSKYSDSQHLSRRAAKPNRITVSAAGFGHCFRTCLRLVTPRDGFFPFHSAQDTLLQWPSADHMRSATATGKFSSELLLTLWKLDRQTVFFGKCGPDHHYHDRPTLYSGRLALSHALPGARSHKESF